MDMNNLSEITIGTYVRQWWRNLPAARRRRWGIVLASFMAFWLAGALHAPNAVAGLARLSGLARLLMALGMGGFSFLWRLLKVTGVIEETLTQPHLLWLPLALLLPAGVGGFLYLLSQPPNPLYGMQKLLEAADQAQG